METLWGLNVGRQHVYPEGQIPVVTFKTFLVEMIMWLQVYQIDTICICIYLMLKLFMFDSIFGFWPKMGVA